MALQKSILEFSYAAGFTEKVAKQVLDASSSFTTVSNLSRKQAGALVKRPGNTALTTAIVGGGAVAKGQRVYAYRDEIDISDGTNLYSYSPEAVGWRNAGLVPECTVSRYSLGAAGVGSASVSIYDVAFVGGYVNVLRQEPNAAGTGWLLNLYVYDAATLSLVTVVTAYSGTVPYTTARLVTNGTTAMLVVNDGTNLATLFYNPATLTIATANSHPGSSATFCDITASGTGYVAVYSTGTSPVTFHFEVYGSSGGLPSTTFTTTSTGYNAADTTITALAIGGNTATDFFFAYVTPARVAELVSLTTAGSNLRSPARITGFSSTGVTQLALTVTAPGSLPSGTLIGGSYASNNTAAATLQATGVYYRRFTGGASTISVGSASNVLNAALAGRPSTVNGRTYVQVRSYDPLQQQSAFVEITGDVGVGPFRPVAFYAPRLSEPGVYCLPSTSVNGTTVYGVTRTLTSKLGAGIVASVELLKLDFSGASSAQGASYALELGLTGGVASLYDGRQITESNFWTRPIVTAAGTGTGSLTGAYQVAAVYAYVDAAGNVERSAPSIVATATVTSVAQIACQVDSPPVTSKFSSAAASQNATVEIYRTIAAGSIFYFDQSVPMGPAFTLGSTIIASTQSDTTLQANPQLYSQPGNPGEELAHQCPSGLTGLIVHADRLVGIGDDGVTLWYSSQYISGALPWWQSQTVLTVDAGGRVRALGSMLGNLYVFQRDAIWVIEGAGPPPNGGTGQEFTPPELLASDVGCLDPRSVVLTPMGLLFRSARGLYLIDQSNNVSFVGEDVQLTTAAYPVTSSVVLLDAVSRVYWTMLPSEGATTGIRIVFDYQHGTWSTDVLDDAATGPANVGAVGAALCGGYATTTPVYTWLSSTGYVHQENAGWLDGSTWVEAQLETPPIHLAGILGFQRVWSVSLLFERITPHDIEVDFAYDMGGYTETHTFTAAQIAAMPSPNIELSVFPKQQKCRTLQVRVSDGTPTGLPVGTGQGSTWVAMRLEIGSKGTNRNAKSEEG